MIIILNREIKETDKNRLTEFLSAKGFKLREIIGEEDTIIGAVGILRIDIREVELFPGVNRVIPITKPYKLASREFKKADTITKIGNVKFGGLRVAVIAGPCAIESREQILESARLVKSSGAVLLRGGAYKPRTSPYSFQGLAEEGLKYLKEAGEKENIPVATEIVSPEHADMMKDYIDMFQIGARNMQNFELLKKVGSLGKPVLLKRGLAATIEEWLMAAEYLIAHGTDDILLCERGIRTFETYTRNTLDLSAIPVVKKLSHLPVIVDPSHATGRRGKVPPMALAAIAAGADGLMVEVHPNPKEALSDGPQSLYPEQFEKLMRDIEALSPVIGKEIERPQIRITAAGEKSGHTKTDTKKIAFQGVKGAFSEVALNRYFGNTEISSAACSSFRKVYEKILSGETEYGIIPIENSLTGSIHENYDLMLQFPDLKIIGEQKIRIEHNLISIPGASIDSIKQVYSHTQGLAQCREYLDAHPLMNRIPFFDTAGSVAFIAESGRSDYAAIASKEAAEEYKMEILKAGIETNPRNYTRFFILASEKNTTAEKPDKASIVFSTQDKPGALFSCLKILNENKLNMKKLESRPIPGKPWEYMFYIDLEVPGDIDHFWNVLGILKGESDNFRMLGMYRS